MTKRSADARVRWAMRPRVAVLLCFTGAACVACDRDGPRADPAKGAVTKPSAAPASSGKLAKGPGCPLAIVPGASLGSVKLGATRAELEALSLPVESRSKHEQTEFLEVGPVQVELCGGKVVDVWIDDLRKAPDCVTVDGKKVDLDMKREAFEALFKDCRTLPPRIGGAFVECAGGGVKVGHGLGSFIQVRVTREGSRLDDTCAMLLDDGGHVELEPAARRKLLQRTLDLDLLASHWHRDEPGRDPLHVRKNAIVEDEPALSMFGSPVVYKGRAALDAKDLPYFEFTKLESSATKTTVRFRYPAEGVIGRAVFVKRGDEWTLEKKHVAEQ